MMSYIMHYQAALNEFNQKPNSKILAEAKVWIGFFHHDIQQTSAASPCSTLNPLEMKSK